MRTILPVGETEFYEVRDFYWELIDKMQGSPFFPGWEKKVYPSDDFIMESLKNNEMYVCRMGQDAGTDCAGSTGSIAAAMVLNHKCNDGYAGTKWTVDAGPDEIMVIHALGVTPGLHGQGIAGSMVREAIRIAVGTNQKAIRLDVLNGNTPAVRLYEGLGFSYRRTSRMYYEDTGWTDYLLYELPLNFS